MPFYWSHDLHFSRSCYNGMADILECLVITLERIGKLNGLIRLKQMHQGVRLNMSKIFTESSSSFLFYRIIFISLIFHNFKTVSIKLKSPFQFFSQFSS